MIPTAPLHDAYMAGEDSLHKTEFERVFLAYLRGALEIAQTNALLSQGRLVSDGTAAKPGHAIESEADPATGDPCYLLEA